MSRFFTSVLLILLLLAGVAFASEDVVLKAMRDELARSMKDLKLKDLEKPYFMSYRVDEWTSFSVSASLGAITNRGETRRRMLSVDVRVGNYEFDNTNFLAVDSFGSRMFRNGARVLPLDDDYNQLRREMWLATDAIYRHSASDLEAKRSVLQQRSPSTKLDDFLKQQPLSSLEPPKNLTVDMTALERVAREVSKVFVDEPEFVSSGVTIDVRNLHTRFINSEGTVFTRPDPVVAAVITAQIYGKDGVPIKDSVTVLGTVISDVDHAVVLDKTRQLISNLKALREASPVQRYNGPVLFEGEAAGEVVSQVFAPAVAAFRFPITDKPEFEAGFLQFTAQFGGVSLAEKLGARVTPEFMDIVDDPAATDFAGSRLLGTRKIDDEGVTSRAVKIVEGGILKNILSTRTPTPECKESTGSKRMFGPTPSNLIFSSRKSMTAHEIRGELLRLAKLRGYDYGIVVRRVGPAGLSWITRMGANAAGRAGSAATATGVFKVYADGREEMVRGGEIEVLTTSAFRDIVAAGDKPQVYTTAFVPLASSIFAGLSGNMAGDALSVVSYVVPSLLFEQLTIKPGSGVAPTPPVLSSPLLAR